MDLSTFNEIMKGRRKSLTFRRCATCGEGLDPRGRGGAIDYKGYPKRRFCSQLHSDEFNAETQRDLQRAYRKAVAMAKSRVCAGCRQAKLAPEFVSPLSRFCLACAEEREGKLRPLVDKEGASYRKWQLSLAEKYGITPQQYEELLRHQEYGCAVCGKTEADNRQRLAVDHNHVTGKIRGLLCRRCNALVVQNFVDDRVIADGLAGFLLDPPASHILPVGHQVPSVAVANRWTQQHQAALMRRDGEERGRVRL